MRAEYGSAAPGVESAAQQVRQLGDVARHAPRLVARQVRPANGPREVVPEVGKSELVAVGVLHPVRAIAVADFPGLGEAAGHVENRAPLAGESTRTIVTRRSLALAGLGRVGKCGATKNVRSG
jgi:hypothetical protein